MRKSLTILLLFFACFPVFAQTRDYYSEADKLYRENRWAEVVSLCLEGLSQPDMPEASAIEIHSVLGASYARLGAFGKAADSMKKCLEYDISQGETKGLTSSLINLASMYVYAGEPEQGEEYALRAIENEESVGRPVYLARAYGKACDVYHALGGLGRRAEALAELDAAEAVFRSNDAKQSLSVVCFQKAQEYGRNGDIEAEVRSIASGYEWFGTDTARLIERISTAKAASETIFTPREMDVVRLSCQGLQYKEIASRLGISYMTVVTIKNNIFRKLGINNTVELVLYAVRKNLISL